MIGEQGAGAGQTAGPMQPDFSRGRQAARAGIATVFIGIALATRPDPLWSLRRPFSGPAEPPLAISGAGYWNNRFV
jgi:hypothetical protein